MIKTIAYRRIFKHYVRLVAYAWVGMALLICCCKINREPHDSSPKAYSRIISIAPSITETLFALSLGDKVVGVSSFCTYPQEVQKLPKIGGYTDPNYEMILRLKPDLVILLKEQTPMADFLKMNAIDYLLVDNNNLSAIIESFHKIGNKCGASAIADSIVKKIRSEIIVDSVGTKTLPKVFLCVDRENQGCGTISQAYSAGDSTFYNDLLKMAGMINSVSGSKIAYPQISVEGIIALKPDIIIDIAMRPSGISITKSMGDWESLTMVPAVKNKMIFCLAGDYLTIPGPRILKVLMDFKHILSLYHQNSMAH
jgi:iron complex transport system substrate-binding protein